MLVSTPAARFRPLGLLTALGLLASTAAAQTAAPTWGNVTRSTATAFGGFNTTRLTVAPDGSQYLSGVFSGTLTLGGTTYTAQAGGSDLYLAKLSPSGAVQWVKQGKTSTQASFASFGTSTALDAAGNVYFAGYFPGRADFGNGLVLTASVGDVFVLKFDAQGGVLWSRTAGATSGAGDPRLAVDAAGNVLVSGIFAGSVSFGSTAVSSVGNDADVFVAKLSASGVAQWLRRAGGTGSDQATDIGVDAAGNAYVTGYVSTAATFGTVTLNPLGNATLFDLFLAKYSPQGTVLWAQRGGSTADDAARAVAVDADGYAVISGYVDGVTTSSGTRQNIYLARYSPQGTRLWEQRVTPSQQAPVEGLAGESVAYDGRGGIYVTGYSNGQLTFGTTTVRSREGAFVARYDLQGNAVWADRLDGATSSPGSANAHSVGVDAAGNAYLAGEAAGDVYFGSLLSSVPGPVSLAFTGPFVARLTAGGPLATATARSSQPLRVFPNPAQESATLQLPAGGGRLVVFDALGRAVREQALPVAAGPYRVELSGLAPGLYRLQATLAGEQVASAPLLLR